MMENTLFIHLYTAFNFNNESVWMINLCVSHTCQLLSKV